MKYHFSSMRKPELKKGALPRARKPVSVEIGQDLYFLAHRTVLLPSNVGKWRHLPPPDYVQRKSGLLNPHQWHPIQVTVFLRSLPVFQFTRIHFARQTPKHVKIQGGAKGRL